MLRVFNDTACYVDQGGGKRKGAFAVYLEPWHVDIFEFLELRKNHGKEEHRARDSFFALWVPDLLMERVQSNGEWSFFCPNEARGLADCWGQDFEKLYLQYEREVSRLQEQLQAERDLRAAFEVGLSMSSVQFSGSRGMDSKTRAELDEIALAEALALVCL
ncbi:hypothetical protein K1719_041097 [Acacia pycnantha]|nr:hypothetical protein K1719_041097 [Acacia pycnantha]